MVDYRFVAIFLSPFLGAIVTPLPLEKKRYFPEQVSVGTPIIFMCKYVIAFIKEGLPKKLVFPTPQISCLDEIYFLYITI